MLALFATGVSNAHVSLVITCSFAALRLSPLDCSSLPCSPRSDASFWNESQMHSVIDQASQTPESAPTCAPARYTSTVLGARRLSSLAPLSVKTRLPDLVSRSMSPFGFLPLGYWTNANAALEAVIEQSCPGLSSSRPKQALWQLCAVIYNFVLPTSSPTSQRNFQTTNFEQHHSSDPSEEALRPQPGMATALRRTSRSDCYLTP